MNINHNAKSSSRSFKGDYALFFVGGSNVCKPTLVTWQLHSKENFYQIFLSLEKPSPVFSRYPKISYLAAHAIFTLTIPYFPKCRTIALMWREVTITDMKSQLYKYILSTEKLTQHARSFSATVCFVVSPASCPVKPQSLSDSRRAPLEQSGVKCFAQGNFEISQ